MSNAWTGEYRTVGMSEWVGWPQLNDLPSSGTWMLFVHVMGRVEQRQKALAMTRDELCKRADVSRSRYYYRMFDSKHGPLLSELVALLRVCSLNLEVRVTEAEPGTMGEVRIFEEGERHGD